MLNILMPMDINMPYTLRILFYAYTVGNIYMLFALSNISAWDAASMHHCFGC